METIEDIIGDIREFADKDSQTIGRDVLRRTIQHFADRIKVAVAENATTTPTCEKSSQVGNAAEMYEALRKIHLIATTNINECACNDSDKIICKLADEALSKPPRNCDIMDWRTAWAKWRTELHTQKPCGYAEVVSGTEQFMDWYMSEAKGDAK